MKYSFVACNCGVGAADMSVILNDTYCCLVPEEVDQFVHDVLESGRPLTQAQLNKLDELFRWKRRQELLRQGFGRLEYAEFSRISPLEAYSEWTTTMLGRFVVTFQKLFSPFVLMWGTDRSPTLGG